MRARAISWLAWALAGLSVAMFSATMWLFFLSRSVHNPSVPGSDPSLSGQLGGALFLIFPLVGALISSRHPRNPVGWVLIADGLLWMLLGVSAYYGAYGLAQSGSVPFPLAIASISNWLWAPAVGLFGTYLLLLFPDGRLPSRRWRPLAWLSGAVIFSLSAVGFLAPGRLVGLGGARNPFGLEGHPWVGDAFFVVIPLLPLCILAAAVSIVVRFRRSRGEERQQIKWVAFAASVMGSLFLVGIAWSLLSPPGSELLDNAAAFSYTLVPIAVGVAILRYRLYEIDILINRALVYGSLTALLALVYAGGVVGLQAALRALSGQESTLAIVASTLAIAALFGPLRRRVQRFVDRRFYRSKYDAARTLDAFSVRLRDETRLDTLSEDLVGVVTRAVQPAHASLWLRPETGSKREQAD
jgi:MFS family permease